MFELSQIRCFVAVAEELHFGKAAARLNMTQPPLSRQIQLLEHAVGTPLLFRSTRVVELTPAGRRFLREARALLRGAETAVLDARRVAQVHAGEIAIGFTAGSSYRDVPELVARCRALLPDVNLKLREMVSQAQLDALLAGRLDLALVRPPVVQPALQWRPLRRERLLAVLPEGHAYAERASIALEALDGVDFVMYSPDEARYFYDLVSDILRRSGVRPRHVQYVSQIHSILALVRARLGMALVPAGTTVFHYEGVVFRELVDLQPVDPVELGIVVKRDDDNPALARLLEDLDARRGVPDEPVPHAAREG